MPITLSPGQSVVLTATFSLALDANPTVSLANNSGIATFGPVTASGTSYSVTVTATTTLGSDQVVFSGLFHNTPVSYSSDKIEVVQGATTIVMSGVASVLAGSTYTYLLTADYPFDGLSGAVTFTTTGSAGASMVGGIVASGKPYTLKTQFSFSGSGTVVFTPSVTVNGVTVSGPTFTAIVVIPAISISGPANLLIGEKGTCTATINVIQLDGPPSETANLNAVSFGFLNPANSKTGPWTFSCEGINLGTGSATVSGSFDNNPLSAVIQIDVIELPTAKITNGPILP